MPQQDPVVQNFNSGGLADSKWSGIKDSLYKLTGFDPHSAPGVLRTAQKLSKDSGVIVTEFCNARLASSNGRIYWGSAVSGKIWERDTAGVWTLAYTVAPGAGSAAIMNLVEYQGTIYVITQSRIGKIVATDAEGASEWTANFTNNWATFTNADPDYHPTIEQNLVLYIGDGKFIAQIDDGVFSAEALDVASPLRISSLGKLATRILAGTFVSNNITKTQIVDWDTFSDSFNVSDTIDEVGIHAFLETDNYVLAYCGYSGNLYSYNGEKMDLYKKIPGEYSPTAKAKIFHTSVANIEGQVLFGMSNVLGNPCDQGIYRIGRHSNDYDYILDFPYPISRRTGSDFVLTGIEMGGILVVGADIYAGWRATISGITMTIANPGVFTLNAHGLSNGDSIIFSTTASLPTGITAGTIYYVGNVATNTFNVYDTAAHAIAGGATGRVTTTGSQSGTHSASIVGIDKLDYSTKLNGAYFETRIARTDRFNKSTCPLMEVAYASLPASTDIKIQYKKNYADSYADTTEKNDDIGKRVYSEEGFEFVALQAKVQVTTNNNDAPEIEALHMVLK